MLEVKEERQGLLRHRVGGKPDILSGLRFRLNFLRLQPKFCAAADAASRPLSPLSCMLLPLAWLEMEQCGDGAAKAAACAPVLAGACH